VIALVALTGTLRRGRAGRLQVLLAHDAGLVASDILEKVGRASHTPPVAEGKPPVALAGHVWHVVRGRVRPTLSTYSAPGLVRV